MVPSYPLNLMSSLPLVAYQRKTRRIPIDLFVTQLEVCGLWHFCDSISLNTNANTTVVLMMPVEAWGAASWSPAANFSQATGATSLTNRTRLNHRWFMHRYSRNVAIKRTWLQLLPGPGQSNKAQICTGRANITNGQTKQGYRSKT